MSEKSGARSLFSEEDANLESEIWGLVDALERILRRRAFDERLPECRSELGRRLRSVLSEMSALLRDHSIKMIGLVEALAGANRLYSEKIEELSSMRKVSDALSSTLDICETCRVATEVLVGETGAERCYLFLVDEQSGIPVLRAMKRGAEEARTFFSEDPPEIEAPIRHFVDQAVRTCQPIFSAGGESEDEGDLGQIVCFPLLTSGKSIGVAALIGSVGSGVPSSTGRILGILASQISAALVYSHLYARLATAQKVQTIVETAIAVNHQINNPLSIVLSSVGMLRRQIAQNDLGDVEKRLSDIEEAVSDVQDATQKLASIISPVVEEYTNGTRMISLTDSATASSFSREEFLQRYKKLLEEMRREADERSCYEPARTESIAEVGSILGRKIGLSDAELEDLRMLCLWHDVGVVAIDDKILRKPSKLDSDEMRNIKEHPKISEHLLQPVHGTEGFVKLVRHHHEDVNGEGYPDRVSGAQLPLTVRIHRVVEAYVAMRSDRPFRPALSPQEAQNELVKYAGIQFDPDVVESFLALLREQPSLDDICSHKLFASRSAKE